MDIKNATVFVTGANRGLGLAFAREARRRLRPRSPATSPRRKGLKKDSENGF